jgi:hypothetical protein
MLTFLTGDIKKITYRQCCGSVILWDGSGSADPYFLLKDPDPASDPAIFVSNFQDGALKKSFFAYYFWKLHLRNFPRIKSHKKVTGQ